MGSNELFGHSLRIQILQDFPRQWLFDFDMPWNRFHNPGFRIDPKGVRGAFPFQITTSDP